MGFNITELVESKGWKKFMAKLYGWGASVVIVGALFKIQHWPGAGPMLILGLSTEAIIFFFSAFEPIHEEIDWTLAYPELAGIDLDEELEDDTKKPSRQSALEKFDAMLEKGEIEPELFEKLGNGLRNLNETTSKLYDVADATTATNNYVANFEKASEKVSEFADFYGNSAQKLNSSADQLSQSYINTSELVSTSASQLADSYGKLTAKFNEELELNTENNKSYSDQLDSMTKNLTALNAVYELQLQGTNEHLEATKEMYGGLGQMMENLSQSVEDTKRYREEVSKLGNNLAALNTIYGNMLSAMNFNPNQG
jgi:gliding motility-associated protein GldL